MVWCTMDRGSTTSCMSTHARQIRRLLLYPLSYRARLVKCIDFS